MNTIHCRIAGCPSKFETNDKVTADATFLCSNHPRSAQVEAIGRVYDPVRDERDSDVHFQTHAFDGTLDRGGSDYEAEPGSTVNQQEGDIERSNA